VEFPAQTGDRVVANGILKGLLRRMLDVAKRLDIHRGQRLRCIEHKLVGAIGGQQSGSRDACAVDDWDRVGAQRELLHHEARIKISTLRLEHLGCHRRADAFDRDESANRGDSRAGLGRAGWAAAGWAVAGWAAAGWAVGGWIVAGWAVAGWIVAGWAAAGWTVVGWTVAGCVVAGWAAAGWAAAGWTVRAGHWAA
jgi:hypothetical protein